MERRLTTKLEHHCLEATTATTTTTTTTAQQQQQQQAFCFFSKIRFFFVCQKIASEKHFEQK
jgi:hypothetical protein